MSMQWFRLYHRMIDDDKLRLLAFEDRWHFVALCCLKADGLIDEQEGSLRDRKIAVKLGVQVRELEEIGRRLQEVGLVDERLSPVAWDELQFKSDRDSTAARRQREKRQRDRELKAVTKASRVTVTNVTRLDTETDTDITPKGVCETDVSRARPVEVVEAWNITAERLGLSKIAKLTDDRKRKLSARCKDATLDDFRAALAAIERSRWLQGDNDRGWKANFDFFLQPKSFTKLIEGAYD